MNFHLKKGCIPLIILSLAGLLGLFFSFKLARFAFPEIQIDFDITSNQAQQQSIAFLKKMGINDQSYKKVTIFEEDTTTKSFLDKLLGPKKAGEYMNTSINAWNFTTRFFTPSIQEEYLVALDTHGKLSGFLRIIPEKKSGKVLDEEQAKIIAENFLTTHANYSLDGLLFIEKNMLERDERRDFYFVWERKDVRIQNATYRVEVNVAGDEIVRFSEYLKVPENWQRAEEQGFSYNLVAQRVAQIIYLLFIIAPLYITLFKKFKQRKLRYRMALKIAIAVGMVSLLSFINILPLEIFGYDTLVTYSSFWSILIFLGIITSIFEAVLTFLLALSAESLYREISPTALSLEGILSKNFFQSFGVLQAICIGFFSGILVMFYQMIFYSVGRKFGFWVPAEINYSNLFSTPLPWTFGLFVGFLPALQEEMYFRLFGISFLKKVFKKTLPAILITSFIWSFLHSAYPQQPFFARGIELGLVGIFFSWLFLRYGIIASITAHYTLNAALSAQFLFKYQSNYVKISSIVIATLPLLIGLMIFIYSRRRGETQSAILTNINASQRDVIQRAKPPPQQSVRLHPYQPLKKKYTLILGVLVILSALVLILPKINYSATNIILKRPELNLNRYEIIYISDKILKGKNVNPAIYYKSAKLINTYSASEIKYLVEKIDPSTFSEFYNNKQVAYLWKINYLQEKNKEGYEIFLLPDSQLYSLKHILPEDTPKESLDETQALQLAQNYLRETKKYDIEDHSLVDTKQRKLPQRMEYTFTFQDNTMGLSQAAFLTFVDINGNEVNGYSQYLKIPEDWLREKDKFSIKEFIIFAYLLMIFLIFIIYCFLRFLVYYRAGFLPLKKARRIILILCIPLIAILLNMLATFFSNYSTVESIEIYFVQEVLSNILGIFVFVSIGTLLLSLLYALWKENISQTLFPQDHKTLNTMLKESCVVGYGLSFVLWSISPLLIAPIYPLVQNLGFEKFFISIPEIPKSINDYIPVVTTLSQSILQIFGLAFLAIPLLVLFKLLKRWWLAVITFCLVLLPAFFLEKNWQDVGFYLAITIFVLIILTVFSKLFFKKNIITPFVMIFILFTMDYSILLWNTNTFLKINSAISFFTLLLPLIVILFIIHKHKNQTELKSMVIHKM